MHGKDIASVTLYVLYIGTQHERHSLIFKGLDIDFSRVERYYIVQYIECTFSLATIFYHLTFEDVLCGQLFGNDDYGFIVDIEFSVLLLGCLAFFGEERVVDILPEFLIVFDGGTHLASQFYRWLFVKTDRKTMPESHSGRKRHVEIIPVKVFRLDGDGLLVDRKQSHVTLIFGRFKTFYGIVVLRAEHIGQYEGIITVERQGSIKLCLGKEREKSSLQGLVWITHVHQ